MAPRTVPGRRRPARRTRGARPGTDRRRERRPTLRPALRRLRDPPYMTGRATLPRASLVRANPGSATVPRRYPPGRVRRVHRTGITATLLAGIAVTAVSGCVSVEPPRKTVAPRPGTSRPVQDVAPQIVQPPVLDSLEALPDPAASASAGRAGAPSSARDDAPRTPRRRERADAPRPQAPRLPPRFPGGAGPVAPGASVPVTGKDVCALGRGYGRWPAGSPQSRICDATYGR